MTVDLYDFADFDFADLAAETNQSNTSSIEIHSTDQENHRNHPKIIVQTTGYWISLISKSFPFPNR